MLNLLNVTTDQITCAYGSLIKTDSLYNLCFPVQRAPAAVCQNGVMDYVLHPSRWRCVSRLPASSEAVIWYRSAFGGNLLPRNRAAPEIFDAPIFA